MLNLWGDCRKLQKRILGQNENEGLLVRQLTLENTNPACRVALQGKTKDLDISGIIKLCNEVDPFTQQVSKSISLAIGAVFQKTGDSNHPRSKPCCQCGQPGHFARERRVPRQTPDPALGQETIKPAPLGICPLCKRGRHWTNECHSRTDAHG